MTALLPLGHVVGEVSIKGKSESILTQKRIKLDVNLGCTLGGQGEIILCFRRNQALSQE